MLKVLLSGALLLCLMRAPAQAAPKPAAHPTPAAEAIMAWLNALAAKDAGKLAEASALPFTLATDYKRERRCDGTAKDQRSREKTFRCLFSYERILVGELQSAAQNAVIQGAEPAWAPPIKEIPPKLRRPAGKLGSAEGQSLVGAYLNGDGVAFQFLFAVRPVDGKLKVSGLALGFALAE